MGVLSFWWVVLFLEKVFREKRFGCLRWEVVSILVVFCRFGEVRVWIEVLVVFVGVYVL